MSNRDRRSTVTDDDLDELLDDVLDNFSSIPPSTSSKSPRSPDIASAPLPPEPLEKDPLDDFEGSEYARQLAENMEELVKGLEENENLRQTIEALLEGVDGKYSESTDSSANSEKTTFQDKINQTINKLQKSSDEVDAEVSEEASDEFLAEMMKQMESLGDNNEFQNILEGMMEQLTSKEILYEPIRDLAVKYPKWLEQNKEKVPKEEYGRYKKQSEFVQKIVEHYEAADYDENNEQQNKIIVDLMQELQDCGQPPAEILAELAPEMELDEQGLPKISPTDLDKCNLM